MKGIPEKWQRTDEWYNYKNINADLNVVATLDEEVMKVARTAKTTPLPGYMIMMVAAHSIPVAGTQQKSFE